MKNKVKYILLAVGVALIIFGALIPTMFKENSNTTQNDKFDFNRNSGSWSYSITISIASEKEYEINSAVITMKNAFNEYDLKEKSINSPTINKSQNNDQFIYTFTFSVTSEEFFDYTEIEKVVLNTSIGTRTATENKITSNSFHKASWKTPVMIIVIFFGASIVLGSIMLFVYPKIKKSSATKIRQKVKNADPSIRLEHMTDDDVLSKYESYLEKKAQTAGINLDQADEYGRKVNSLDMLELTEEDYIKMFGGEVPSEATHKICGYCGSENDLSSKKCSSCGANLKSKK